LDPRAARNLVRGSRWSGGFCTVPDVVYIIMKTISNIAVNVQPVVETVEKVCHFRERSSDLLYWLVISVNCVLYSFNRLS
jgi:hypothetical protein